MKSYQFPHPIGLCGPKGSGKSTLAEQLASRYYYERIAFSDGIKAMLLALYEYQGLRNGRARRMVYGDLKEAPTVLLDGRTTRRAFQTLGTEWGRELISPTLWIHVWARKMSTKHPVVAEDVRYLDEMELIVQLGGKILRIERPGYDYNPEEHPTEGQVDPGKIDNYIVNDGTKEDLLWKAEKVLGLHNA